MIIDKSNMRQVILDSSHQLEKGLNLAENHKVEGVFKNVIVCGIGGSALPVNVLNAIIKSPVPIYAHRDYGLPEEASGNSLIICISYSGNTEETISALEEAVQKNLKVICIATGGKIEEICKKTSTPLIKIPAGIQPRSATGYIFSALAKILSNSGVIKDITGEISEAAKNLESINSSLEKEGKKLAKKLVKKNPVVYASNKFKALARIWKIKFNENSKIPAFHNYFPELNHNEMVGYTGLKKSQAKNLFVIVLQDSEDHPRILKRMKLTSNLIKKSGAKVETLNIKDGSPTFKIFSSLMLGDWVSYYLALEYKIDPTPVKIVEEFKKLMAE
jgi:glucose/mannose-6-phosphate isomerase